EDRLAAALLLHGQSPPPGRGHSQYRCRLGSDRPDLRWPAVPDRIDGRNTAARLGESLRSATRQGTSPRGGDGSTISLDLVGRCSGRPLGTFPMHLEHASEIVGPPEMNTLAGVDRAVVEFDGVSKWYGNVIGLNKLSVRIAHGVTGLLGPNG